MQAKFTYFKPSGKYYDQGQIDVDPQTHIHVIWEQAIAMFRGGDYPGLAPSDGERDLIVTIEVPGHDQEHPFLFIPRSLRPVESGQYHDPERPAYTPLRW